jgi:hypothetical protein
VSFAAHEANTQLPGTLADSDEKSGEISRPGMYELSQQKMMVATRFKGSFSIRPAAFRKGTESLDHGNYRAVT